MTADLHPLRPGCRRDYWMTAEAMAEAQVGIAAGVRALETALAPALEGLHGETHAPAYWQRTIGPFLWQLACYVFDRVCDALPAAAIPAPSPDLLSYSARDFVNQVIERRGVCALLDATLALPPDARAAALAETWGAFRLDRELPGRPRRRLKASLRRSLAFWEGVGEVTHYGAPFTTPQSVGLAIGSGGRIRAAKFPEREARLRYDGALRCELLESARRHLGSDPLAAAALELAVFLLPTAFVEQYRDLREALAEDLERPVRVVATAQGFVRSPAFAVFAATHAEKGARIAGLQHGGFYGQMEETWGEIAEHEHSDVFCTWGYRYREHDHPMPPPRLAKLRQRRIEVQHPQAILWAMSAWLYMVHVNASVPHYRRYEEMNRRQMDAVRSAMANRAFELRVRPYPRTRQDPMLEAWATSVPQALIDPGGCDLITHARRCALLVFNFPGATGFLECLRTDTPAIIYCPADIVPVRPEAQAVYEGLAAAGLYLRTPEELGATIAERLEQGPGWWRAAHRVAACEAFRRQFAWGEAAVVPAWRRFFREQAARAVPPPG